MYIAASCWCPYHRQLFWLMREPPKRGGIGYNILLLRRSVCLFTVPNTLYKWETENTNKDKSGYYVIHDTLVKACTIGLGITKNKNGSGLEPLCDRNPDLCTSGHVYPNGTTFVLHSRPGQEMRVTIPMLSRPDIGPLSRAEIAPGGTEDNPILRYRTLTLPLN